MTRSATYRPPFEMALRPADVPPTCAGQPADVFEHLFAEYQQPILNYVYRLVNEAALAEDLTQEAFARAWRARAQLAGVANQRAWLYRIATNAARDHLRRARLLAWLPLLSREPGLAVPGPEETAMEAERMRRALVQLPPDYRIPLVLFTCQDFTVSEIAATLGLSNEAVKQRLVRARNKLREAYK